MNSIIPYSVIGDSIDTNLPFLKVVGNLDVSGNLTVDGKTFLNDSLDVVGITHLNGLVIAFDDVAILGSLSINNNTLICGSPPSAGASGNALVSRGALLSPQWLTNSNIFAPVVFYGRLAANLAMTDGLRTNLTNITSDVINVGGTNLNSTTGRFTCPATGVYNLFLSMCFVFTGNNGTEGTANLQIYNSGGVLQREYLAQNYAPTGLLASTTSMININYTLTAGFYVLPIGFTRDPTVPATIASTDASYFGGSRLS